MRRVALGLLLLLVPLASPQFTPDLGPVGDAADTVAGQVIPPTLNTTYTLLGQNITQEDVDLFLDLNITKGEVTPLGFLVGSGNIEVQADIQIRGEMRVISSDRIRALIEGDNAYNLSAENATFLSEVFLPAELFRATFAAEVIAAFQEEMETKLIEFMENTVPELQILSVDIGWENTSPLLVPTDTSLTEPPLVITLDATVQYLRVESFGSLMNIYLDGQENRDVGKKDYVKSAKADASDPLRTRDFFAAAAYDQLLNLSMQPGWSLEASLAVPRGYSFEYTNENVESASDRELSFRVDGDVASEDEPFVFIASVTHRGAVAMGLLLAMLVVSTVGHTPLGLLYNRFRLRRKYGARADGD